MSRVEAYLSRPNHEVLYHDPRGANMNINEDENSRQKRLVMTTPAKKGRVVELDLTKTRSFTQKSNQENLELIQDVK